MSIIAVHLQSVIAVCAVFKQERSNQFKHLHQFDSFTSVSPHGNLRIINVQKGNVFIGFPAIVYKYLH
jgi:hypothetical protein